jgi:hypothetical protein
MNPDRSSIKALQNLLPPPGRPWMASVPFAVLVEAVAVDHRSAEESDHSRTLK